MFLEKLSGEISNIEKIIAGVIATVLLLTIAFHAIDYFLRDRVLSWILINLLLVALIINHYKGNSRSLNENNGSEDENGKMIRKNFGGQKGSDVYLEKLRELKDRGVIDEWREELIEPGEKAEEFEKHVSFELDGYDRLYIHEPEKQPSNRQQMEKSLIDYLMYEGKGFRYDGERIYNFEEDYRQLLKAVLDHSTLEDYKLEVEADESDITVRIEIDGRHYELEFEQIGDFVSYQPFKLLNDVLGQETGEVICYAGSQDAAVLVLPEESLRVLESIIELDDHFQIFDT